MNFEEQQTRYDELTFKGGPMTDETAEEYFALLPLFNRQARTQRLEEEEEGE